MYAVSLPRFRTALLFQTFHQALGFAVYFPLLFVRSPAAIIAFAVVGMAIDLFARYAPSLSPCQISYRFPLFPKIRDGIISTNLWISTARKGKRETGPS